MINRSGAQTVIKCDDCGDVFTSDDHENWSELWPRAQRDGWKSRKIGHVWVHGCPKCGIRG